MLAGAMIVVQGGICKWSVLFCTLVGVSVTPILGPLQSGRGPAPTKARQSTTGILPWLPALLCLPMTAFVVYFVLSTLHWPLIGDAAFVHYVVFLWQHGMTPFRQIVETQLPGVYLSDWLMIHLFGGDAAGLRRFDFFLLASALAAMFAIAWPRFERDSEKNLRNFYNDDRWAAFLAGGLFALIHGGDGIPHAGERDLVMAVLLLVTCAFAFQAIRTRLPWLMGAAAFCACSAVTIKPTVLLAAFCIFAMAGAELRRRQVPAAIYVAASVAGSLVPLAANGAFLAHYHAWPALAGALTGVFRYYAALQRRSFGFLLLHSVSPVLALAVLWLAVLGLRLRNSRDGYEGSGRGGSRAGFGARLAPGHGLAGWESRTLHLCCFFSLVSYIAQGKGFPYHRYPFLVFLLLLMMLEFKRALGGESIMHATSGIRRCWRVGGVMGLCAGILVVAPLCVYKISRIDWRNDDFYHSLSADLNTLGGRELSGNVQCLDAFAGCVDTLYRMGIVQSTGFLVDFYFYAPEDTRKATDPVVYRLRGQFLDEVEAAPPRVFVVTDKLFPNSGKEPDTFDKLKRWPQFDAYLSAHYSLFEERTMPRPFRWTSYAEPPARYRIYVRKS